MDGQPTAPPRADEAGYPPDEAGAAARDPGPGPAGAVGPAIVRLNALAPLPEADRCALEAAAASPRTVRVRRVVINEGEPLTAPILILSGWAGLERPLADGRRQILGLRLPGELLFGHDPSRPAAPATLFALSDLVVCHAPAAPENGSIGLAAAYAASRARDEHYLMNQVVRLGRKSAFERVADLLLELCERLDTAGLVSARQMPFPLTQELIGDALGLTSVHVNRTLQVMRREHMLTTRDRHAVLHDPRALARLVDFVPAPSLRDA